MVKTGKDQLKTLLMCVRVTGYVSKTYQLRCVWRYPLSLKDYDWWIYGIKDEHLCTANLKSIEEPVRKTRQRHGVWVRHRSLCRTLAGSHHPALSNCLLQAWGSLIYFLSVKEPLERWSRGKYWQNKYLGQKAVGKEGERRQRGPGQPNARVLEKECDPLKKKKRRLGNPAEPSRRSVGTEGELQQIKMLF